MQNEEKICFLSFQSAGQAIGVKITEGHIMIEY